MILFIVFIVAMGITMVVKTNEYAEDNYYEKDLVFEQDLKAKKNAIKLNITPKIFYKNENIVFQFLDTNIAEATIQAEIYFQKPNNKKLNFKIPLTMDKNFVQMVSTTHLEKGIWNIWIKGIAKNTPIQTAIEKINIK